MILKEFGVAKSFAYYTTDEIKQIDSSELVLPVNFDGFYQNHELGRVIFIFKTENPCFIIGKKRFFFDQIQSIDYKINGSKREVVFETSSTNRFCYETFWIDEVSIIEFALGYPDDDENDLMKVIFNRVNTFLLKEF